MSKEATGIEGGPIETPNEDLRRRALDHYEEAATAINHWSSVIPRAINEYFDRRALSRSDTNGEGVTERELREKAEMCLEKDPRGDWDNGWNEGIKLYMTSLIHSLQSKQGAG